MTRICFASVLFFPKSYNSSLILRRTSDKARLGQNSCRMPGGLSLRLLKAWKTRQRSCHRTKTTGEMRQRMQCSFLDWILEQKEDINGKTCEIQRKVEPSTNWRILVPLKPSVRRTVGPPAWMGAGWLPSLSKLAHLKAPSYDYQIRWWYSLSPVPHHCHSPNPWALF